MKLVSECATSSSFRVHKNGSLGFFIKCVVFHTFAVFFSFRVNFLYILNEVDSVARTLNNSYSLSHILTFSWILSISNTRCMSYTTLLCTNGMFCCYSRQAKVFLQSVWKQKTLNKAEHGLRFGKTKSQPAVCVCIYVSACVLPETACLLSTAVLSLSSRNCVVAFSSLSHRHTDTHTHKTYTHTHKTYTHTHTHTQTHKTYTHTQTHKTYTHTHTLCNILFALKTAAVSDPCRVNSANPVLLWLREAKLPLGLSGFRKNRLRIKLHIPSYCIGLHEWLP